MQQDYARLEEWVSRDSLLPLDEFLADGTIDMTNITDAAIAGGRIDDKLYGHQSRHRLAGHRHRHRRLCPSRDEDLPSRHGRSSSSRSSICTRNSAFGASAQG